MTRWWVRGFVLLYLATLAVEIAQQAGVLPTAHPQPLWGNDERWADYLHFALITAMTICGGAVLADWYRATRPDDDGDTEEEWWSW